MKRLSVLLISLFTVNVCNAQIELDLSMDKGNTIFIDLDVKFVKLINAVKNKFSYLVDVQRTTIITPVFDIQGAQNIAGIDKNTCSKETQVILGKLDAAKTEKELKEAVNNAKEHLKLKKEPKDECVKAVQSALTNTEIVVPFDFKVKNNQIITVTISKFETGKKDPVSTWTFILKTEEKTRWLTHYGLTYTPSAISKMDHYHAFADTSVANRYTINKNNDNGPKPWENISATINFTYPFHGDSRGFDGGFTAGFGINAGLELSGHAGLSAVIGDNVILGTGIAFMQKQKLKGQYKDGQIIKENLAFDALHEKVWLPEIFFTIGFRFGSNPFAKKESKTAASTPNEE